MMPPGGAVVQHLLWVKHSTVTIPDSSESSTVHSGQQQLVNTV